MKEGVAELPMLEIGAALARRVSHGQVLELADLPVSGPTRVVGTEGELLAIYQEIDGKAKPDLVLA